MVWRSTCEKRGELGCQVAVNPGQLLVSSPFIVRFLPGRLLHVEAGARYAFVRPGCLTTTITWTTYLPAFFAALVRGRHFGELV